MLLSREETALLTKKSFHVPFLDKQTYHTDILHPSPAADRSNTQSPACPNPHCPGPGVWQLLVAPAEASGEPAPAPAQTMPAFASPRLAELFTKSVYVGVVNVVNIMAMLQMPESFTKWTADKFTEQTPLQQWEKMSPPRR
jgi:hypothetical protein